MLQRTLCWYRGFKGIPMVIGPAAKKDIRALHSACVNNVE
jgi:hypothetical protein